MQAAVYPRRDPPQHESAKRNIIRAVHPRAAAMQPIPCRQQTSIDTAGATLERKNDLNRPSITRFIVAVIVGTTALVALAQESLLPPVPVPPPWWPVTEGSPVVSEWYSDLPWHQKLGTYAGNQIDEPIVLPYKALPQVDIDFCNANGMKEDKRAECMIEVGVLNVLGMYRIDTKYTGEGAIKNAPECKDASLPCIQVMIRVANFYAKSAAGHVSLAARVFGDGTCGPDPLNPGGACVYKAYTLSDGTTYAPQMPWYMSHYCDGMFTPAAGDFNDAICYGDYLSTFNDGFNALGGTKGDYSSWPRSVPWSVWPRREVPGTNVCREGETVCNFALAGFDLQPLTSTLTQYSYNNDLLLQWFNNAFTHFKDDQGQDNLRHFPWSGTSPGFAWTDFLPQSVQNPYLGTYDFFNTDPQGKVVNCNAGPTGPVPTNGDPKGCTDVNGGRIATATLTRASQTLYPRQCNLSHLVSGDAGSLRKCGLNYELHHNGWLDQWPPANDWQQAMRSANMASNQYGRTSFMFAGVPGMQLPVSFWKETGIDKNPYSIYEQVYNTSMFSMYLPMANEADTLRQMPGRFYSDDFYHTLLMSNHNESDPNTFADGIRGKTLWHNEYRTHYMYDRAVKQSDSHFPPEWFSAAFVADNPAQLLPFHNNTCDGCHLRNGSGVPIKQGGKLDKVLQDWGMTANAYNPNVNNDYTFTGVVRPMKLVFFDLGRSTARASASTYSTPLAFTPLTLLQPPRTVQASALYYDNAIMNYYGDSFHVTAGNSYTWDYIPATPESQVVAAALKRKNPETGQDYVPMYPAVSNFKIAGTCQIASGGPSKGWPKSCADVSGDAVGAAIQSQEVGYMLLNGRRLGNSSAIEAMPDAALKQFRSNQVHGAPGVAKLGEAMAGEIVWTAGSRDGVLHPCNDTNRHSDCFLGRFGWLGDRATLEDQVANAAFVEMNMTSKQGYAKFYGANGKTTDPIRYAAPNCGPANKVCVESKDGNSDLTERDIERMADYSRWVGNPTRSEFQVTLPDVVAGEKLFRRLQCNTCHVIDKVSLDPLVTGNTVNTMLPAIYRSRLANRAGNNFLSYIGTDLLMHDMGYLSQVGIVPANVKIRDADGVVLPQYQNFVQKIRTPALKGMRFNRYVTESYKNTNATYNPLTINAPACDFLLHDGRACDAVEAAFLHDGPAINKMGIIDKLNQLFGSEVLQLRAFLYSL